MTDRKTGRPPAPAAGPPAAVPPSPTGALAPFTRDDAEILARDTLWQGRFRVDRYRLRHRLYQGGWSREFERVVFERGHAAAVLPYDPVGDAVVLVEQFRPGALAAGLARPWLVEIVAGMIDGEDAPEAVARREAKEEAGLDLAGPLEFVAAPLMTPGACSERVHIFCGRVNAAGAGGVHGLADENENIRVLVLAVDEARALLDAGRFENAITVIALQWLLLHRARLKEMWR